ncbi:TetR/AcrR family transcriptional regulator [Amycolatopsis pittospori]|uniref:TetR/AcrR family transcriptional regulator n=1 Tax=Amycolatopsis pittospori TaxID=2749434 RepID=UPI0015F00558|nr:TetR family transcriptional regulator C-terminal domain-containing protein [Amycolatopsis pittospori]
MTGSRGKQQARSRERRELLLRAAMQLICDSGVKAVTHRAVSASAGLPQAAAGYYFATSEELIAEALRFHIHERIEIVQVLLADVVRGAKSVLDIGERLTNALVAGKFGVTVAQYELYMEAARNPAMRTVVDEAMSAFEASAAPLLASLGVADSRQAAKAFMALLDGLALHRLANPQPTEADLELTNRSIQGLFLAFVTDPGELRRQTSLPIPDAKP